MVNRSLARAEDLVREAGEPPKLRAGRLEGVHSELAEADVVLTAVAAESHVLTPAHFSGVAGPMLVIDLGVPRNVDPVVAMLAPVTLLDMDTLSASVARALGDRQEESVAARAIVADEVERFRTASRQRGAAPVIGALRARLESLRESGARAPSGPAGRSERGRVGAGRRRHPGRDGQNAARAHHALEGDRGHAAGERLVEALRILFDL